MLVLTDVMRFSDMTMLESVCIYMYRFYVSTCISLIVVQYFVKCFVVFKPMKKEIEIYQLTELLSFSSYPRV